MSNREVGARLTLFLLFTLIAGTWAFSSTVRGKIQRPGGQPVANVKLTLKSIDQMRSAAVYTGTDGLYYFQNVAAGNYDLEIWVSDRPLVFSITVSTDYYTDIAPITIQ